MAGSRRPSRGCILQRGTRPADSAALPDTPDHGPSPVSGNDLTDEQFDRKCAQVARRRARRALRAVLDMFPVPAVRS